MSSLDPQTVSLTKVNIVLFETSRSLLKLGSETGGRYTLLCPISSESDMDASVLCSEATD